MPDYIQAFGGDDEGYQIGNAATSKVGLHGAAPSVQCAVVTTVDSTTITTVDTTVASTGLTAEATLVLMIEAHALAINRLIADVRSLSKATNQIITKTRTKGLFASS